uniref:Centromere-associated protein E n=1 Tax=Cyclopterus lumpus TaxID=8103 RepID=A0A8C2ZTY0_CYCLU
MAEESAVKVCVRVRPLIEREENAALENAEPVQLFWKADKKSIHQIDEGNSTKSFVFDRVFTADETTNQLYQDIAKPLVVSTVEGYNGTVFAYGQTSSGKTFTMMGSDRNHGVIPLAVEDVFQTIQNCPKKEFLLRVSYMEIYNETVSDLLVDSWKRKPLEVRETINKNIFVADLTEELVTSSTQALAWIRKGEKNRRYGKTKMNERSSRSHTIFRMILESRESSENAEGENADGAIIVSHLNLVDLAGSERTSQTGADGTRFKEGCNINRSLFTLSQVIKKLTDESQKGFTNYRDSKLTRILQNSLGGNAKTVIICTITPVALDETLSTLQFASTAKKMKNDPHVTEVSDDGALLKRYRNEIVDLKRRLTEVSSVTQTTATEKKVLSQLIQEKDQLQREQQDRIRNLTKLLVTSSNLLPKRRVTWGGKMIRLGRPSACEGPSDLSFADSFTRKRKAESSCLMDLCEGEEEPQRAYALWKMTIPLMSLRYLFFKCLHGAFQTTRTLTPNGRFPLCGLSSLLYICTVYSSCYMWNKTLVFECLYAVYSWSYFSHLYGFYLFSSPKDFVSPDYIHKLSGKVSHLEHQLDIESLHKEEAMTRAEASDGRVAEMELQLQTDAHQKRETLEKMQRAAELELQLQTEAKEANEKVEMLTAERDYLKQEIGMFIEETERLENENAVLSEEMAEKKEMDEFRSLEEDFRKGHEVISLIPFRRHLNLQVKCRRKLKFELPPSGSNNKAGSRRANRHVSALQSGKDLVQEVATLRRSLNDAEGLSRDTKKEWAHLRSKNIAVEEMNVTLSANSKKMEAEVNGLRGKLETEKSRNRALQSDLQKELNVAFDENTKLTALLDGKVPKNLMDGVELERTVARLNRELTASHEAEGALRAQLEELASFQTLPDKVEDLTKQILGLSQELQRVRDEKDALLSEQRSSAEEAEQLLSTVASLTAERDQLQTDMQDNVDMMIENQQELRTALDKTREQKERIAQLETAHTSKQEDSPSAQTEELQTLVRVWVLLEKLNLASREETERLQSRVTSLSEERDQLQETLEALRQEKRQLRAELEDRMETVQTEVGREEETLHRCIDIWHLCTAGISRYCIIQVSKLSGGQTFSPSSQMSTLTEKLQLVEAERDALLSEKDAGCRASREETERLQSRVTSLSEERDQLQETLEALRQEKRQLRAELEDRMETVMLYFSVLCVPWMLSPCSSSCLQCPILQMFDGFVSVLQALHVHIEQLEEARLKASSRVSNHKEATQLLQTELQDSRAQVQEKDHAIQSLKSKLRQSEVHFQSHQKPFICMQLLYLEYLLFSALEKCVKMSSLLSEKEEYVRKLKETLRKTQQEGEDSCKFVLFHPLETSCFQIVSLSSSRDDIGKWKRKAVMLRVKGKAELDKPSSPCTPTKRGLSVTSDASNFFGSPKKLAVAPRKVPDSPTVSLPDSPKSRFSDLLSRSYPKQFFDNSNLGLVPGQPPPSSPPHVLTFASLMFLEKEDWWPMSPKQEEMCKTQ